MKKLSLAICLLLGTTGAAYAAGDATAGQQKSAACAACHGPDGNSPAFLFPNLAGQHVDYLVRQIKAFKSNDRVEPQMAPIVAPLTEQDMEDLAAYFSSQEVKTGKAGSGDVALGKKIYKGGNPDTGMAACASCHGPKGEGNPGAGYPQLTAQYAEYTEKQLKAYKGGTRAISANAKIMQEISAKLTEKEMKAVSGYILSLPN